jgi:2-polyprenyl-3-methyl-5-hydroxy-6-metoxy-1,4-benzoquinol methylase
MSRDTPLRPEPRTEGYRNRLYDRYVSQVRDRGTAFDGEAAAHWARPYSRYLDGWLPDDLDAAVLDAACGDGKLLSFFLRRGFNNVHGVDLSPEQVALARQVLPSVGCEDVRTYLASRPKAFDLIIALDLLEHLTRDEALDFLQLAHASLRPRGRLVLQTPNGASPWVGTVYFSDMTHEVCYTAVSLGAFLRIAGFQHAEFRECDPTVLGIRSAVRAGAWRIVRSLRQVISMIETGHQGGPVFTRVFLASARVG